MPGENGLGRVGKRECKYCAVFVFRFGVFDLAVALAGDFFVVFVVFVDGGVFGEGFIDLDLILEKGKRVWKCE